jgi:hypothetical protein
MYEYEFLPLPWIVYHGKGQLKMQLRAAISYPYNKMIDNLLWTSTQLMRVVLGMDCVYDMDTMMLNIAFGLPPNDRTVDYLEDLILC